MIKLIDGVDNLLLKGDCLNALKELEENSVDAIITDPPYGLSFMGKKWDYAVPGVEVWKEAIRVLKPGGFLLSFAGTRTYHRMAVNIEDAGFEIRDMISWLYGSGFPKSLNIGKQIDKIQGNKREVVSEYKTHDIRNAGLMDKKGPIQVTKTKGNSEWEGWETALKPACEPIVVARKPLSEKNVALNVLKWGTGGINIDACRVGNGVRKNPQAGFIRRGRTDEEVFGGVDKNKPKEGLVVQERFPANIILDEEAGKILDKQSGISKSSGGCGKKSMGALGDTKYGKYNKKLGENAGGLGDKGGASRFFYCAKASKSERNLGCENMEQKDMRYKDNRAKSMEIFSNQYTESSGNPTGRGITSKRGNNHPTVKPIKLMEYLVKLVSKEGATVLDPFLGSGTTGIACIKLNRKFIGIELNPEYIKIAEARIKPHLEQQKLEAKQ